MIKRFILWFLSLFNKAKPLKTEKTGGSILLKRPSVTVPRLKYNKLGQFRQPSMNYHG